MIYEFRDEEQFKDMKFYKHFLITQEYGRSLCEKEGILGFIESDGIPLGIDFDDSYKDFSREDLSNIVNAILARAKVAFKQQYENDLRGELDYKAKFGIERINFRPEPTHFVSNIKPILEAVENADIPKEAKKEFFENNLSSLELSFYTGYIGLNNWIQEEMPNSKILKEIVGNKINEIKEADIKISVNDKNSISYEEKCFNKMLNDYKADNSVSNLLNYELEMMVQQEKRWLNETFIDGKFLCQGSIYNSYNASAPVDFILEEYEVDNQAYTRVDGAFFVKGTIDKTMQNMMEYGDIEYAIGDFDVYQSFFDESGVIRTYIADEDLYFSGSYEKAPNPVKETLEAYYRMEIDVGEYGILPVVECQEELDDNTRRM